MSDRNIELDNVAAVEHLSIEVPAEGGLVVLEGPNGIGKTNALNAIEARLTGKGTLPVRDGAPTAEVNIFGTATLRMSRRISRLGHLECSTLEGKLSIADFVDPQLDNLLAADAHRIKALLQLTGAKADPSLFYELVGGQQAFDELVDPDALSTDDLVTMSKKVKAALEKAARTLEAEYAKLYAKADAVRLMAADVEDGPCDEKELNWFHENAIREESRLTEAQKGYNNAKEIREKTVVALDRAKSNYKGLTLETADKNQTQTAKERKEAIDRVKLLEKQLHEAKLDLMEAMNAEDKAIGEYKEAANHNTYISELEELLAKPLPEPVLQLDLDSARTTVELTSKARDLGTVIRNAKSHLQEARGLKEKALKKEMEAKTLREAAESTNSVLAEIVESLGLGLSVNSGRLIVTESDRLAGSEYFDELSKGEKCAMAIEIAIKTVSAHGPGGVFTIPQEFYEGLNPANKQMVAQKLYNSGVVAITAQAVDGDEITVTIPEPYPLSQK